ncbi:MAG: hypothetical protein P0Y64_16555 [Candidatus Sphingomonas colombiensis]|nr:hypothetical protein [Sphingomonas sp.]WEK42930.1 MAG: hypothetical protein P0Y64_16555 [Sphingomonas sp.]
MGARASHWRQDDIKRAINAAEKSRLRQYRVDIATDGTISIVVGGQANGPMRRNTCDDLLDP